MHATINGYTVHMDIKKEDNNKSYKITVNDEVLSSKSGNYYGLLTEGLKEFDKICLDVIHNYN